MQQREEIEAIFCRAIDLMVSNHQSEAEELLEGAISTLRERLVDCSNSEEIALFQELWGDALSLMEEPEQALLHYEKGLQATTDQPQLLWKICRTLLEELERYSEAEEILTQKLLPLDPQNSDYLDALDTARGPQRYKQLDEIPSTSVDLDLDLDEEEGEDALDHADFYSGLAPDEEGNSEDEEEEE